MSAAPAAANSRDVRGQQQNRVLLFLGLLGAVGLIAVGALMAGRRDEQLISDYGRKRGAEGLPSVNGTAVLGELFKQAGHRVSIRTRFSPRIDDFDVVVWTPDDFKPPTKEQREYLEGWLQRGTEERPRTIVYVGRDYDAAVAYWDVWSKMAGEVAAATADEALRRQAEARASHEKARSEMPEREYARWFTAVRDEQPKQIEELTGPWAEGIDAQQAKLHLEGRLAVPTEADRQGITDAPPLPEKLEVLLAAGADPLVSRVSNPQDVDGWRGGQVLVVTNGSFVLNYPLVNTEHRKLASRLVRACGKPGGVVFIESGDGGPKVLTKEPSGGPPTPLDLLKVWPLNVILLHLAVLGIIFCLARSPIFGRPRELAAESPSDFGKHVAALGQLLARTKDRNYAQARLAQYQQGAERKSGKQKLTAK